MESELYLEILLYMGIRWLPILHVILPEESLYNISWATCTHFYWGKYLEQSFLDYKLCDF